MHGAFIFALCLLLFLTLLAGRHSDSTPGNYCCLFPLLCVFLWMYQLISVVIFSWTGNEQEWTWCCSRMDIPVCVFSLSVFFVVVCNIFICAVLHLAPEHLCDHGLDLWDQLMWEFNSIQFKNESGNTWQMLSNAWCYFCFLCSSLAAVSYITVGSSFWLHSECTD